MCTRYYRKCKVYGPNKSTKIWNTCSIGICTPRFLPLFLLCSPPFFGRPWFSDKPQLNYRPRPRRNLPVRARARALKDLSIIIRCTCLAPYSGGCRTLHTSCYRKRICVQVYYYNTVVYTARDEWKCTSIEYESACRICDKLRTLREEKNPSRLIIRSAHRSPRRRPGGRDFIAFAWFSRESKTHTGTRSDDFVRDSDNRNTLKCILVYFAIFSVFFVF